MPTHLDYVAVRQGQHELAREAERVRQEREGHSPAPVSREPRFGGRLLVMLRLRRPAQAPAPTR
jgi:hypothetical protein